MRLTQSDTSSETGNCLQTAVAAVLELPVDQVPYMIDGDDWTAELEKFLATRGLCPRVGPVEPLFGIQVGRTVRETSHTVACVNGEVWDVHPSRAGLTNVAMHIEFRPLPMP